MKPNPKLVVVQFLVPSTDTKGQPYRRGILLRLERHLAECYGGWSLVSVGPLPGGWRNPDTGRVERDVSWRYEVAVPADAMKEFDEFLGDLGASLGQAAMYRVVLGEGLVIPSRKRKGRG